VKQACGPRWDRLAMPCARASLSTLECVLLVRQRFASQAETKIACFSHIEGFYNPVCLHPALGYRSPIDDSCCTIEGDAKERRLDHFAHDQLARDSERHRAKGLPYGQIER